MNLIRLLCLSALPLGILAFPLLGICVSDDLAGENVEIVGVIGVNPAQAGSCIAAWVPVEKNSALSGVKWYNNDGTAGFPEILVQGGDPDHPVELKGSFLVASEVYGESNAWSLVEFSQPIVASDSGVYVVFQIPEGSIANSLGFGGGAGIGYTDAAHGFPGWISAEGKDWVQLHPNFGLAIEPILVTGDEDMMTKSNVGLQEASGCAGASPWFQTMMLPAFPNPFNPTTQLKFSLEKGDHVDLAVYNIRGELISSLVQGYLESGEHSVVWDGRRADGDRIASGVYIARFLAGSVIMTQRLVLVQ